MKPWREEALKEIAALKPHWVTKHGWQPEHAEFEDAIDLYVRLQSRRLEGKTFLLRLRYLADWQVAGRRETFLNPTERKQEGTEFWPPPGSVRAVNPQHQPPCICLKGVWGFHSVLHPSERPDGTTLLSFLLRLQAVLDE